MGFSQDEIEQAGGAWPDAESINDALNMLRGQRIEVLVLSGDLLRSKLAWKFAVVRQSLTYRLVDLSEAAIEQWQQGNTLASMVLARAFFETTAVAHYVAVKMKMAVAEKDLTKLDQLAMQVSFAGRHSDWRLVESGPISVMTALDHMSKEMTVARDYYERISEIAHPNSQGTHQFYATTDKQKIEVTFSRTKRGRSEILSSLMVALIGVPWSLLKLGEIDAMMPQVAALQVAVDGDPSA